jgi:DNA-binding NarL/FixJ family response regulator
VRVGIADDSVLFREGLGRLIAELGFDVAFSAPGVEELMAAVDADPPEVVVVDVRLPPTFTSEGLVAAAEIRSRHPGVGLLVLSQYVESTHAARLLAEDGRAIGYLLKDRVTDLDTISDAIRRVAAGGTVLDPEVVSRLLSRRREHDAVDELTHREREVLALMAEGHSNGAIGERLFIGPKTVETHIGTIFSKLGLMPDREQDRRVQAVLAYLRRY